MQIQSNDDHINSNNNPSESDQNKSIFTFIGGKKFKVSADNLPENAYLIEKYIEDILKDTKGVKFISFDGTSFFVMNQNDQPNIKLTNYLNEKPHGHLGDEQIVFESAVTTSEITFAQLHNNHRIGDTEYAGSPSLAASEETTKIVELVLNDERVPLEDKENAKDVLDFLERNNSILKTKSELEETEHANYILYEIITDFKKQRPAYIELGWPGHSVIVKFFVENDTVCFYILNKGSGISYHPKMEHFIGGKTKRDIRSLTFQMSIGKFKQLGLNFIYSLIECRNSQESIKDPLRYRGRDFYGCCLLYADSTKENSIDPAFSSTAQVSGNCTQASLNAAILDLVISKKDRKSGDRLLFWMKQLSLESAWRDWKNEAKTNADLQVILEDAAKQHLIRLKKKGEFLALSEEQIQEGRDLALDILEGIHLFQLEGKKAPEKQLDLLYDRSSPKKSRTTSTLQTEIISLGKSEKPFELANLLRKPSDHSEAIKKIDDVLNYIESHLKTNPIRLLKELWFIMDALPLSHEVDDKNHLFWRGFTQEEASRALEKFKQLTIDILACGKEISAFKSPSELKLFIDKEQINAMMMIAFDISIVLAEQTKELEEISKYPIHCEWPDRGNYQNDIRKAHKIDQVIKNIKLRNEQLVHDENDKTPLFSRKFNKDGYDCLLVKNICGVENFNELYESALMEVYKEDSNEIEEDSNQIEEISKEKALSRAYFELWDTYKNEHEDFKNLLFIVKASLSTNRSKMLFDFRKEHSLDFYFFMKDGVLLLNREWGFYGNLIPLHEEYHFDPLALNELNHETTHETIHETIHEPRQNSLSFPRKWLKRHIDYEFYNFLGKVPKSKTISRDASYALSTFENLLLNKSNENLSEHLKESEKNISLQILGALALFEINPQIAPLNILSWASDHLENITIPFVQRRIFQFLFRKRILKKNLENPTSSDQVKKMIEKFIRKSIETYKNSMDINTYFWVLKIAEKLDEIHKNGQYDIEREWVKLFERRDLDKKSKIDISIYYLSRFSSKECNDENLALFLNAFYFLHLSQAVDIRICELTAYEAILLNHEHFWELLKNNEHLAKNIAESILTWCNITHEEKNNWKFEDETLTDGVFRIDKNGMIFKNDSPLNAIPYYLTKTFLYIEYFGEKKLGPLSMHNGYLQEADDSHRFLLNENHTDIEVIEKKISINNETAWYRYQDRRQVENLVDKEGFPAGILRPPRQVFIEVNTPQPKMIVADERGNLLYCLREQDEQIKINQINDHVINEDLEIVQLNSLVKKDFAWKKSLAEIETPEHILLTINVKTNTLEKIDLRRLDLTFTIKENKLFCSKLKGFYLTENGIHFNILSGYLTLENEQGETKIIIPFHPFKKSKTKNNSIAMSMSVPWDMSSVNEITPYFVYRKKDEDLISETPEGSLYLSVLYRTENNYQKAIEQLHRSENYMGHGEVDFAIAQLIEDQPDRSPEGIAFYLQFQCRMRWHDQKFVAGKITKDISKYTSEYISRYQKMISGAIDGLYQIPIYLRLNDEQKRILKIPVITPEYKIQIENNSPSKRYDNPLILDFSFITKNLAEKKFEYRLLEQFNLTNIDDRQHGLDCHMTFEESISTEGRILFQTYRFDNYNRVIDFNLTVMRPVPLSYKQNSVKPIFYYLQTYFSDIIDALTEPNTKDLTIIHLSHLSRYIHSSDKASRNLLELLFFASQLSENDLKIVQDKKLSQEHSSVRIAIEQIEELLKIAYELQKNYQTTPFILDLKKFCHDENALDVSLPIRYITEKASLPSLPIDYTKIVNKSSYLIRNKKIVMPLGVFYDQCDFKKEIELKNKDLPILFDEGLIENQSNALEKMKIEDMNLATGSLKNEQSFLFTTETSIEEMKNKIEETASKSLMKAQNHRYSALQRANKMNLRENLEGRSSGQLKIITMSDLLSAYLSGDGRRLQEYNPELSEEEIEEIFFLMMEADLAQYQHKQSLEILTILSSSTLEDEVKIRMIGEIAYRHFDIEVLKKYPQLSLYAAATGLWPRQDQIDVIDWALQQLQEGRHLEEDTLARILQRDAGFGKTKVFTVFLAQIAANRGFLTVIFNIPALYDTSGKEDLSSALKEAFMQNIDLIEWNVGEKIIGESDLDLLLSHIKAWQERKHVLLLKPETWALMHINYKNWVANGQTALAEKGKSVLDFFKNALALMDESHLLLNPQTEVNQSTGDLKTIEKEQFLDLIANYKILRHHKDLGLQSNKQSTASEETIDMAKNLLIENIIQRKGYEHLNKSTLKSWLASPLKNTVPPWLKELSDDLFDRIEQQHRFIQNLLLEVLQARGKVDYGIVEKKNKLYATPRDKGEITPFTFSNEFKTAALSMQTIIQEGVPFESFKDVFLNLLHLHYEDKKTHLLKNEKSSSEQLLGKFLGTQFSLENISFNSHKEIVEIYQKLKDHEGFQDWYFENILFHQIKKHDKKINSNPSDLVSGFKIALLLSATPGALDTYPIIVSKSKNKHNLDNASTARVIHQMLAPRNNKMVFIEDFKSPKEFFDQIDEEILEPLNFMIDEGSIFRQIKNNKEVVEGLNENRKGKNKKVRSAVFVHSTHSKKRSIHFLEYDQDKAIMTPLPGSQLENGMEKAHQDKRKLEDAFYFYSLQESTGMDWTLPNKSSGILTIGERSTLSSVIQAIKRDRKLQRQDHSFTWVISSKVAKMIPQSSENLRPLDIILWLVHQEAKEEMEKIAMRYMQGLDHLFSHTKNGKALFIIDTNKSPSNSFKEKQKLESFSPLMRPVIERLIKILPEEENEILKINNIDELELYLEPSDFKNLKILYESTLALIEDEPLFDIENSGLQLSKENQQQLQNQQQQENQLKNTFEDNPKQVEKPAEEVYLEEIYDLGNISLEDGNWIPLSSYCSWPTSIHGPALYASKTFLKITEHSIAVRPISNLLVILNEDHEGEERYQYLPLSQWGTEFYRKKLLNAEAVKGKKFALISSAGDVLILQKQNMMTERDIQELETSDSLKQVVTLVALTKGKIKGHLTTLKQVFGGCSEFKNLKQQIKKYLTGPGAKFESKKYKRMIKAITSK